MKPPEYYSRFSCTAVTQGGNLPHWSQPCTTFVTFRLADSLPMVRLAEFRDERDSWLKTHPEPWDEPTSAEYRERFPRRFQQWLDAGYGSCVLADRGVRMIVENALCHFADIGDDAFEANASTGCPSECGRDCLNRVGAPVRPVAFEINASTVCPSECGRDCLNRVGCPHYSLYAYVVMPNHVHVLFMPAVGFDGRKIVSEWKRYTARLINEKRGMKGSIWQKESYDHLVRDVHEFNACRAYIRGNAPQLAFDAYAERDERTPRRV